MMSSYAHAALPEGTPASAPLPSSSIRRLHAHRAVLMERIATAALDGKDTEVVFLARQLGKVLQTLSTRASVSRAVGDDLNAEAAAS